MGFIAQPGRQFAPLPQETFQRDLNHGLPVAGVFDQLGAVMRVDLDWAVDSMDQLADVAARSGGDGAVAVIVSADYALCLDSGGLIGALAVELRRCDTELVATYGVDRIAAGGRWHCGDGCGAGGVLSDPAASRLADRAVLAGRRLYSGLDELLALVAADADRAADLLPLIIASGAGAAGRDCAVRAAVAAARRMAAGAALSDTELAAVGASLTDRAVRDVLFTAAASDVAAEAAALWTVLARVLPRPWRAEALALLAVSTYVRGDGSLAGTAVLAALADDAEHPMAGMLDTALQAAVRPEEIRELLLPAGRRRQGLRRAPTRLRNSPKRAQPT